MGKWKEQLDYFLDSTHQELCGIDGEPFEFEWNISQDTLKEVQMKMTKRGIRLRRNRRSDHLHVDVQ